MSLYYTVKEIQEKEHCGRDAAYELASQLPHERRGKGIYVFAEDYDNYYKEKRAIALEQQEEKTISKNESKKIYKMRRLG